MSVDRIISAESGGNPYAKNPRSSATGAGQFIDSTWLNMVNKYRPDLAQGLDRGQILALRNDPALSKEMVANYATENKGILGAAGVPVNDGTAYLAHFAGPQGAIKVLQADPNASVGSILGDKVVAANPFLKDMTASQLSAWASNKMGGQQPAAPAQPAAPDMADWYTPPQQQQQSGQPMGILPPAAQSQAPSALGNFTPTKPQTGALGSLNQAPPDFESIAGLLQPLQMKRQAPTRGLFNYRG